jgi:phosphoserine phosphatase
LRSLFTQQRARLATVFACLLLTTGIARAADSLTLWNEGRPKSAIIEFVNRVTQEGGPDFVPPAQRIAVFDNDGTLWCEQPMYVQLAFSLDRVKSLAPHHPKWKEREPFKAVLKDDLKALAASGKKGLEELLMATHAGMTTDEFSVVAKDWLARAKHPRFHRLYTECVYSPMLELLSFLRANGFKTYIVSGGGVELIRAFSDRVYGVPSEQVIGSTIKTRFEVRDGKPVLVREAAIDFIDDKAGKPVAINKFIGRRPLMAFGNSDGDFEMLEWTTAGLGPRFGLLVHHTDAAREYAYDRKTLFGRLHRGLDEAEKRGWILVDMKRDWKRVFAFER